MSILSRTKKDTVNIYEPKTQSDISVHEENQLLKSSLNYLKVELNKFKEVPLLVCEVKKTIGEKAVIKVPNGNQFLVNISGGLNVSVGDMVLSEQRSLTIVQKIEKSKNLDLEDFIVIQKPNISWESIGGLKDQINELKEVVELPLKNPGIFKKIGIDPPKGVLLYGEPGTGKTLLAKAVATSANATFIEVVASELVQKFIGEGARLVRDLFALARERAPSIVFIDEIDALAAERVDHGTGGEREVQRTLMQLLTEIDGFNILDQVKIIAATNRFDILDQALLRPGRFDRLIEIPVPDQDSRVDILKLYTSLMNSKGVEIEKIVNKTEGLTGADLKAVCTEAAYFAIREQRTEVIHGDFEKAVDKILKNSDEETEATAMFG